MGDVVRGSDLFGIPVQLTYKGSSSFNTICGGCVSILLVISLAVYFSFSLSEEFFNPQFLMTPIINDVSS